MNVEFCSLGFATQSEKTEHNRKPTEQKKRILSHEREFFEFDQIATDTPATTCDERQARSKNKNQKSPSARRFLIPTAQNWPIIIWPAGNAKPATR
jgi:hypothetical protein